MEIFWNNTLQYKHVQLLLFFLYAAIEPNIILVYHLHGPFQVTLHRGRFM